MKPNETMTYLAERVREILGRDPRVTEKHMFGGLTFLLDGHILVGTKKDGRILLSVGRQNNDAALSRPGATPMVHNNRSMTGFVWVEADAIEDDDDLRDWVQTAYDWVANLPAADPKAKARTAPAKTAAAAAKAATGVAAGKAASGRRVAKQAARPSARSAARSRRAPA
jgi:TfoX/Sxy family transcriptional regulator of competence genes